MFFFCVCREIGHQKWGGEERSYRLDDWREWKGNYSFIVYFKKQKTKTWLTKRMASFKPEYF